MIWSASWTSVHQDPARMVPTGGVLEREHYRTVGSVWSFGTSSESGIVHLFIERNKLFKWGVAGLPGGRNPFSNARRLSIEHSEHQVTFAVGASHLVRFRHTIEKIRQPSAYIGRKAFRPWAVMGTGGQIRSL